MIKDSEGVQSIGPRMGLAHWQWHVCVVTKLQQSLNNSVSDTDSDTDTKSVSDSVCKCNVSR